ncbi:MAG TPA: SpoIIE family protein phosphatase [Caulobacteraceae bacterium]
MEEDTTRIMTVSALMLASLDERVHLLEAVDDHALGQRHLIDPNGSVIGRKAPADIVLADSEISRAHCRLAVRGEELWVADLGSTNGTFVDGARVQGEAIVPPGAVLQVGRQNLKHAWSTRREWRRSDELSRDLDTASAYVHALLPPRIAQGPIRADWFYHPSAKLGGDAFGYRTLPDGRFAIYLIDVSGHGAGAAMHSVTVMNVVRQNALPGADLSDPGQVLKALNGMFPMDSHADMYFTMWYGVFDPATRTLEYASAGHHPAYLILADRRETVPLRTRNPMIGAMPGVSYKADRLTLPPDATLYVFSDGVFEIVTVDGHQWRLDNFLPLLLEPPVEGRSECRRLFDGVMSAARADGVDDDFSIVHLTFD